MSFADLRSSRKAKEAKSFVQSAAESVKTPFCAQVLDRETEQTTSVLPHEPTPNQDQPIIPPDLNLGLPSTLDVRKSPEHGRGVYAKESFGPGSILVSVRPRISVLSTPSLEAYCSSCCAPAYSSGLKRCIRCRTIWYCNATCQNSDWALHKHECTALQSWATAAPSADTAVPSDAVRCLGRILWNIQRKGVDSVWAKELSLLQSQRGAIPPSQAESHTHLAHSVVRYVGASGPADLVQYGLNSAGDLVDLISRFATNTFTLTSFSLGPIGICVAPAIAFTNHSCEPNAVIVFPRAARSTREPAMQLVAVRPIAPNEEVLTAYIDITLPRALRQKALEKTYGFECRCTLCARPDGTDPRASMFCPKNCGGTCPVPTEEDTLTRCRRCTALLASSDEVLDALRIGQEALDKASALQFADPEKALHLTRNMTPILTSAGLTPSCHPLLAMTRLHQELLIASLGDGLPQDQLDDTIRAAARYSSGLGSILPFGHPVRAVALAELGKLLAVDEPSPPAEQDVKLGQFPPSGAARLKMAYETLIRARSELSIGFGIPNAEDGMLSREIREILVRLEKELGVWTQGVKDALEDARLASSASRNQNPV